MNITFLTYPMWPPDFGGELLLTLERLEALAARGHSVTVLTAGQPGVPGRGAVNGLGVHRSPAVGRRRPLRLVRRLLYPLWLLRQPELRASIVHLGALGGPTEAWDYRWLEIVRAGASRQGSRTVAVHSLAESDELSLVLSGSVGRLKRRFLERLDAVVGVSPRLHEDLRAQFPTRAHLLVNGVRDDLFVPVEAERRRETRAAVGARDGEVVFGFLGTVCRRKGFDVLTAAFTRGLDQGLPWRLWVIGPQSPAENRNVAQAEYSELAEPVRSLPQVSFLGRVDDRARLALLLGCMDVFLFPSRREGLGLAPLEAMAAGVPAIISRIAGVTEILCEDRESGLFVTPGHAGQLFGAMELLAQSYPERQRLGAAARARVERRFGWAAHVAAWEALYQRLWSEVAAPRADSGGCSGECR